MQEQENPDEPNPSSQHATSLASNGLSVYFPVVEWMLHKKLLRDKAKLQND